MSTTSACGHLVLVHNDETSNEFSAAVETHLYFLFSTEPKPQPNVQRAEQVKIIPAPGEF